MSFRILCETVVIASKSDTLINGLVGLSSHTNWNRKKICRHQFSWLELDRQEYMRIITHITDK